ncbi:helix-turn-helix transcriptional regulator [Halomonas sp. V046]|uniref:helix-turn-helix transcriptional regulator n=1 Tax=Halomonas sp. V046 TaxID=3459611 RepID=UPI0040450C97
MAKGVGVVPGYLLGRDIGHEPRAGDPEPREANQRVERVLVELHQGTNRAWSVAEVAAIAQCSEQQLRKLFRAYTGRSPKACLVNAKLDIARVLSTHKGMNVAEVADKLGFYDGFHFSKAFKRRFGVAPSKSIR